jgi:hypothetical protein
MTAASRRKTMHPWNARLLVEPTHTKVLIEDLEGDVLKARLPSRPQHPRALLTLLEGLALWAGRPLCAVTCVPSRWDPSLVAALFGGDFAPVESALVRFELAEIPKRQRRRRLPGVGDFRQLYLLPREGGR